MSSQSQVDETRLHEFMGQAVVDMGAALNGALVMLGGELGLWHAMAGAGPMTSRELSERSGVRERYVREWLAAEAASGYVEYDGSTDTFELPPEQALAFADEDSPFYIRGGYHLISACYKDQATIAGRFRRGEGFAWQEHDPELFVGTERFFRPGYRAHLINDWLPALEGVEDKLNAGAQVADVGCGHGVSTILMGAAYPDAAIHGFDPHSESIDRARELARDEGIEQNVSFDVESAKTFPGEGYDLVCFFDCLHDMGDPAGALRHVRETIDDDGTVMLVEPYAGDSLEANLNPVGRMYYAASTLVCTPSSLSQEVGRGLGAQAGEERLRAVAAEAGFSRFRRATETPFNMVLELRP